MMFKRKETGRKRFYSPSEIRKRKGCIGCGGAVLIVPLLLTLVGVTIVAF